ncbi:hypothetical protein M407DRAFT_215761 [Tulasnella calospora MUT 4182]|uniref:Uncharacterized protein n=1 Tax=Tulasnella calospora MUT 4182 TaxID=1051891 RepID=A0A0C3QC74_9AGAM|nr:hypothetical protein M407DRAFT_215761 [Tulasnella calospora MUT 4182]
MVHWKTFALGLLSLAVSTSQAAPMVDVSERGNAICFVIVHGAPTTASSTGTAVTGLELARSSSGAVTLAASGFETLISYNNGGFGEFAFCNYYWLNIGTSSHSYKPLSWGYDDQETFTWSAGAGQIVTALATSTYATTSTFLACNESGEWALYLQTGTDVPSGVTCVETQLQVGTTTL